MAGTPELPPLLTARVCWINPVTGIGALERFGVRYEFCRGQVSGAGFSQLYPGQVVRFSEVAGGGFPKCDRVIVE